MSDLVGKVCVVTGAASGIGLQMCVQLAKRGATTVVCARNVARAKAGADEVMRQAGPNATVETLACDVSSIASIKKAVAELNARHPKIHLLVNNAAVFGKERKTSPDDLELGYAVNTLAPFALSTLLLDSLKAAAPARIVNMTMPTKTPINFDDMQSEQKFVPLKNFEMTKGGSQYLTKELAKRIEGTDVSVVCVSPGLTKSKLPAEAPLPLRLVFKLFGKTPEKGARVPLSACTDNKWKNGVFVSDKGRVAEYPAFMDDAACERLFEENSRLAGV